MDDLFPTGHIVEVFYLEPDKMNGGFSKGKTEKIVSA